MTMTIPRDLNDLAKHWQGFVVQTLRRTGRVKFNAEDVLGYVMLKLCEVNVVAKFHAGSVEQNHPLAVDAEQAAKMLGLTPKAFMSFQTYSRTPLNVVTAQGKPYVGGFQEHPNMEFFFSLVRDGKHSMSDIVRGGVLPDFDPAFYKNMDSAISMWSQLVQRARKLQFTGPESRYLFADVIALSATETFPNQGLLEMPAPKVATVAQWKQYLTTSVSNHSANYARTHHRRCSLEHAPDAFRQFRTDEGGVEFEPRLVDVLAEAAVEQGFDARALLKDAPGLQTRRTTVVIEGESKDLNFFDLLLAGYTIREATKAVGLSRHEIKVLQARIAS